MGAREPGAPNLRASRLRKKAFVVGRDQQGLKPDAYFAAFSARVNSCPKKKLSSGWVVHPAIEVERMKQMQQVSLRYAEIASQQVSGDDCV